MDANNGLSPSEHSQTSAVQIEDSQEHLQPESEGAEQQRQSGAGGAETQVGDLETPVMVPETPVGDLETSVRVPETQVGDLETSVRVPETQVGDLETPVMVPETQVGGSDARIGEQETEVSIPLQYDGATEIVQLDTEAAEKKEQLQSYNIGAEVARKIEQRGEIEQITVPVAFRPVSGSEDEERLTPQQPSYGVQAEVGESYLLPESLSLTNTAAATAVFVPAPESISETYFVSSKNDVVVDATVYPMGFRILVKAPGATDNKIATRFVFESIASRIHVHPEDIMLYCRGERVRFGVMINYEQGIPPDEKGRLWVDVHFNGDKVPLHLQGLRKDDNFVRCVRVRARADSVSPADLIAARRRGFSFDEAIDEIRRNTKSENIVSVAILHESGGVSLPFLGGYRLKKDPSRVFLHAATQLRSPGDTSIEDLQFGPLPREGVSRRTQTYGVSRRCQTLRECYTQTARPDYEVDEKYDEFVIAKKYFSARQLLALQTERAVIIQKMYRKWKARQIFRQLVAAHQALLDRAAAEAAADEAERQRLEEFERRRRATPHTADDFATLRRELEAWRAAEAARISSDNTLSEASKRAALLDLTKRELRLLQELEKLRRGAMKNRRIRRFEDILALMTAPKECGIVSVTTMAADRARELRQLFLALIETPSSVEARLDILLHIKWTVKEFDDSLTREIVELVDREADLLQRGRTASSLKGLRMRLENLFKRFIATPEYNPAVEEVVKGKRFGTVADGEYINTAAAAARRLKPSNVI